MKDATDPFLRHVLVRQAIISIVAFGAIALLAPLLIVIEWYIAVSVFRVGVVIAILTLAATTALSAIRLRTHGRVIEALRSGWPAVKSNQIEALAALPSALTFSFFAIGSLFSFLMLVPGIRPEKLDGSRTISIIVLAITILSAAAIPLYVVTRAATLHLIELCPPEAITTLLDREELFQRPPRRVLLRLVLAVAGPVALVGVGAVLIAHAHIRTQIEQSQKTTASVVARAALDTPLGSQKDTERADAIAAAAELGFLARLDEPADPAEPAFRREADGQIALTVPLDAGPATVRFSAEVDPSLTTSEAALAVLGVLVSLALGGLFGRWLSADLVLATQGVRLLGTESVMRGPARVARPARFEVVSGLGKAIEGLAERFRTFAAAQERALEARDAAQRMRGLLFASVSHDLKSPLNAIIGFAELVGQEPLTSAQRESLELIGRRGRELLALIETILDAARVEAGQLTLAPRPTDVPGLIAEAVRKARDLTNDTGGEIALEVPDDLPQIPVDTAYLTRAIGTIIAHALRTAAGDPTSRIVRVRAALDADPGDAIWIDVEYGSRDVSPTELEALFARQVTSRGRGLTLGLSLARSVVELHGGTIEVHGAPDGRPVCHTSLPLTLSRERPRLSSIPRLG